MKSMCIGSPAVACKFPDDVDPHFQFIGHPLQVFTIGEGAIQGDSKVLGEFLILHRLATKGHSELCIGKLIAEVESSDSCLRWVGTKSPEGEIFLHTLQVLG